MQGRGFNSSKTERPGRFLRAEPAASPGGEVDPAHHAGQQEAFEQPRLRVHVGDGAHAPQQGRAEQELQKQLPGRVRLGQAPRFRASGACVCACDLHTLYRLMSRRQRELERILSCLTWFSMWTSSGLWTWWARSMGV